MSQHFLWQSTRFAEILPVKFVQVPEGILLNFKQLQHSQSLGSWELPYAVEGAG